MSSEAPLPCLEDDLVLELTQFFATSANLIDVQVDPKNLKKCIQPLMRLNTPQATHFKNRIIASATGGVPRTPSEKDLPASKDIPAGFPTYHSITSSGSSDLDWGDIHPQNRDWVLQEKIDGSQCTFGADKVQVTISADTISEYKYNVVMSNSTKSCVNNVMFKGVRNALSTLLSTNVLDPNIVYHLEYVMRLRHNVVVYDRLPRFYSIAYDMQDRETKRWFDETELRAECARIGMEPVQVFWDNKTRAGTCKFLLDSTNSNADGYVKDPIAFAKQVLSTIADGRVKSMLGGTPEGTCLKARTYIDKHNHLVCKTRKFVSEHFKEIHHKAKPKPPILSVTSHFAWIGSLYDLPARFRKVFQRLRDSDLPQNEKLYIAFNRDDKSFLYESLDQDFFKECKDEVLGYLLGDFRMRCVRAEPKDVDTSDKMLHRMQTFLSDDNPDAMWKEFKGDIATFARKSFDDWFADKETHDWIYGLMEN